MVEKKRTLKEFPKEFYPLFMIIIPSIILVVSSAIDSIFVRMLIQLITFVFQVVIVNGLLNDYYAKPNQN